jgi:hypothetical protein
MKTFVENLKHSIEFRSLPKKSHCCPPIRPLNKVIESLEVRKYLINFT